MHDPLYTCCPKAAALLSQGNQRAQTVLAQKNPRPDQRAKDDWKERLKQGIADARLACDRSAQIAGQQDRAEHRGAGNRIDTGANEQDGADADTQAYWIS